MTHNSNIPQLQPLINPQRRRAAVMAVTSGKGGVGKTNIAANLAICLAAAEKKVTLIDADFGLGNLDVVMNIDTKYNISHVISGVKTIEEIIHIGPGGVEIICAGSGIEDMADIGPFKRQRLLDELEAICSNSDIVLIDTAAGIGNSVVSFCCAADEVLVVTTTEPAAMTDAYAMIKVLSQNNYAGRISLVVNMADNPAEGRKVYRQIAEAASRFLDIHLYEAAVLHKDDSLVASVKSRRPVVLAYPKAKITASFGTMTARLVKGTAIEQNEKGFFNKVVNWFC